MDVMLEVPNRLRDVADPCTEEYYPEWSSRGMRAVRCTRPAKGLLVTRNRRVCGVHAARWLRAGYKVAYDDLR